MRDNSPYVEPTSDMERPRRRDLNEACDSCGQFSDDNEVMRGNWLICGACRRKYDDDPPASLRVDSTEPEPCERCTSPTVTPGCASCDPNYTGV